jgi:hypothetical protein
MMTWLKEKFIDDINGSLNYFNLLTNPKHQERSDMNWDVVFSSTFVKHDDTNEKRHSCLEKLV